MIQKLDKIQLLSQNLLGSDSDREFEKVAASICNGMLGVSFDAGTTGKRLQQRLSTALL